jgi:glycosidase
MRMNQIQLMVYGENLAGVSAQFHSPQVRVLRTFRAANPSYAFVNIEISPEALDGAYLLTFTAHGDTVAINYPVLPRESRAGRYQGFSSDDVVYLIVPDRFANGDTTNDAVPGMLEGVRPDSAYGRHGGDLQGVIDHLDYLADLGVSTLWLTPLLENNAPGSSYHGYAATDLYRIDPRLGNNALYQELVSEAHKRGLKVIMDHVSNHIGLGHPWMRNLPLPGWINGSMGRHLRTSHYKLELMDPYSDSTVRENTMRGWFADYMPDLNQSNPFVSKYLIENTIWWIETTGIDGIREDTYPYADPHYLSDWAQEIEREYPEFTIVGEVWINDPVFLAPFQKGNCLSRSTDSHLPSLTDFALYDAFMQVFGNHGSIRLIHDCLAKDFLYPDPFALLTFVDNHDVRRIMNIVQEDQRRARLALTMLLTLRGIPEMLYGTELGLSGGRDHGTIRCDFPGGFPPDRRDAFTPQGRTAGENAFFNWTRQLLHLRKNHPALSRGRLIDFPPVNEVYTYFRVAAGDRLMIAVNARDERQQISLLPFRHPLGDARALRDLDTGQLVDLSKTSDIDLDGVAARIFQIVPAGAP